MTQILCITLIPFFYVGNLIYRAQVHPDYHESASKWLQRLSLGLIGFCALFGLSLLFLASLDPQTQDQPGGWEAVNMAWLALPMQRALPAFVLVMICSAAAAATLWSQNFRELMAQTAFADGDFRQNRSTHIVPLILAFVLLAFILGTLAFRPQDLTVAEISMEEILLQAFIFLACALLGVGYPLRRNEGRLFARLGLRVPVATDWWLGLAGGLVLLILVALGGLIWQAVVSPAVFQEQTAASREFVALFRNIPLMVLISLSSAVSEEIMFRGALQPIFGLWSTSLFFTFFHIQYGLNPALLLIFLVGLGLGILRRRWSTSAAIIAHFTYNFLQLIGSLGG